MIIRHDERAQKFYLLEGDNECALLYKELSEKLWNFTGTCVPENFYGSGAIERMIEYAITFVKKHDIKILASCSDVQDFLIKHKDLKDLLYHPY